MTDHGDEPGRVTDRGEEEAGTTNESEPKIAVSAPDGVHKGEHPLRDNRVTIGRAVPGHSPDISLAPDPQAWISRLHCWLERVAGSWYLVDNGSVNGTLVERQGQRDLVNGRRRLHDKDEILILGYLVDNEPFWWRLRLDDPFATVDATPPQAADTLPYVEYRLAEAKLFVIMGSERTEVTRLGPTQHKLVRYMASRNAANRGTPVTCTQEELITAVWGEPETWPPGRARTAENLRDLVFELRRKLRPHESVLETVSGIGYSLRTAGQA